MSMSAGLHNIHYPAKVGLATRYLLGVGVTAGQTQLHLSYTRSFFGVNPADLPQQHFKSFSSPVEQGDRSLHGCARAAQFPVFSFRKVRGCHMPPSVATQELATTGNLVANDCQGKDVAVRCWREAVAASGLADKEIAADAGLTAPHYSKIATGGQGDLLGLAYKVGEVHPQLKRDFIRRLAEEEFANPKLEAAQEVFRAMYRWMRLEGTTVVVRQVR